MSMQNQTDLQYYVCHRTKQVSKSQQHVFDEFINRVKTEGPDTSYSAPYPKYQFLNYLADYCDFVFHGSTSLDLQKLKPVRCSTDTHKFGNQEMLFATPRPLWAMWFAILDKESIGFTSNGTKEIGRTEGNKFILYWFSVDKSSVSAAPYRTGMIYVLPSDSFTERQLDEWGTFSTVKPFLRMLIEPGDFPFLDYVKAVDYNVVRARMQTDPDGAPWLSDSEVFPVSPEIPENFRADKIIAKSL